MKKHIKNAFLLYCALLLCQIIAQSLICFNEALYSEQYYTFWHFSEWLINYEGGFVRRGLIGEIILSIYNEFNIDISLLLYILCYFSTFALIILIIILFKKKGLSLLLIPTVILLGGFAINIIPAYRRDALMLLIIYLALYLFREYEKKQTTPIYILFCIVGILVILVHEASFFCFAPFIFIHQYINLKDLGFGKRIIKSIAILLPILVSMGAVCIYKGDQETANTIWNSYSNFFTAKFNHIPAIGLGVEALTWNSVDTFWFHFCTNYTEPLIEYVPRFFAWVAIFFFTFYLCANVNKVRMFSYEKDIDSVSLITILIIQFIALMPLFTVLSCDLRRIIMYWTITTFFIFTLMDNQYKNSGFINSFAERTIKFFNKSRILSNEYFYIFIAIIIICPYSGFPINIAIKTSVIGNIIEIANRFISLI